MNSASRPPDNQGKRQIFQVIEVPQLTPVDDKGRALVPLSWVCNVQYLSQVYVKIQLMKFYKRRICVRLHHQVHVPP